MFIYTIGALTMYYRTGVPDKGRVWRRIVQAWGQDNDVQVFDPSITYERERNHLYDSKMCVDQNDFYISKCDIAIVNLDDLEDSPGSIYELVRFKEQRKPVIAFGTTKFDWSPHINSCISNKCESLDDAMELIVNMFDQGNFYTFDNDL